ncbi:hypothetical protein K144316041_p20530 (plasmid) [Clostridium tetani]|uniref:hypothetical protein n=1 Tax=Clostridium tetani TaxID=1513 RepID=UPI002954DA65|nr:hypothetical protein [Clostridium tetani]BDR74214.1 hypothetical protein K144316041_p20530 [Clostridium tetani]
MKNKIGCLVIFLAIIINITIGAWSVSQILSWFGKSIPMIGNALIGLFVGEISIPIAIIGYILKLFGIF